MNGVTSFAVVEVSSRPSDERMIVWGAATSHLKEMYDTAVDQGVEVAAQEHERRGGQPQRVEVVSLTDNPADTRPDAVACAAAIAAWKSWGHPEGDASVVFEEGAWKVAFLRRLDTDSSRRD